MSQFGKTGEESMEEILASIRSSVDTPDSGSAARSAPPEVGIGAGQKRAPDVPVSNGRSGRLQDALLSAVPAATGPATPTGAVSASPNPIPKTSHPSAPELTAPVRANGGTANGDTLSAGVDDLSDLFAEPPRPAMPSPGSAVPPSDTAQKISAAPFGTAPTTPDAPKFEASEAALSSDAAAALVKPTSDNQTLPEAPQEPTAPEVIASMAAPSPAPSPEATPAHTSVEPKPKREPSFAALKTLASGPSSAKITQTESAETPQSPSLLLPERRDLPGTNPVAQMQSMAATTTPSKSDGFIPSAAADVADTSGRPDELPVQSAIKSAAVPAPGSDTPSEKSAGEDVTGLGPAAQVDATANSRSLEDIVVELLKPQLSQWLEANMPRIVERALRAEQGRSSDTESS